MLCGNYDLLHCILSSLMSLLVFFQQYHYLLALKLRLFVFAD